VVTTLDAALAAPSPPGADSTPSDGLAVEPAPLPGAMSFIVPATDLVLRVLNRWFMVPVLQSGLGAWVGSPMGGYILLLRIRGRRSGRWRITPLSYLIADGAIWVMAGFGARTQWYRNLLADPVADVWLPGRTVRCTARTCADPGTRAAMLPRLTRAAGVPGALIGCNPWSASDERIVELLAGIPLVRLDPSGGPIAAGPDDPGGYAWLWRQVAIALVTAGLVAIGRRPRRGRRPDGR
jgi:deazaflavin-dependent oxidoreductase (nitroreductase family)